MNCPECNSTSYLYVAKHFDNGNGFHVRMQCQECGYLTAQSFKKEFNEYPNYDESLYQDFQKKQYEKAREELGIKRVVEKERWHNENDEYYFSEKWKRKRVYILNRDNYLCQMCLTNQAVHVHHLSYQHFSNELTSELISVCKRCHEIIHDKEPF
jgi:hypothetical protein